MNSTNSIGNIEGVIDPTNQKERFSPTKQSFLAHHKVRIVDGSHDQTTALSTHQRVPTNTPEHSYINGEALKVSQRTAKPKPLVSQPSNKQFDNRYNSEWAKTVDETMKFVQDTLKKTPTYYKYLHAACDREIFELENPSFPINECTFCPEETVLSVTPSSNSKKSFRPPNQVISYNQAVDIDNILIKNRNIIRNETNWSRMSCFQLADIIIRSEASGHGNCQEMAMLFATRYLSKYPSHTVEVLKLEDPGDHVFTRVSHADIGTIIVDPWAFRYFVSEEQDEFLTNVTNSKASVLYTHKDLLTIANALPENLPKTYQIIHESLKRITGLQNKIGYTLKEIRKMFPNGIKENYQILDDNDQPISGNFKIFSVNTEEGRNTCHMIVITEFGLHRYGVWQD